VVTPKNAPKKEANSDMDPFEHQITFTVMELIQVKPLAEGRVI
jgi:hypothetical protein